MPPLRIVRALVAAGAAALIFQASGVFTSGAVVVPTVVRPAQTSFTGIDPGKGQHYSYAPSVIQTGKSTRSVFSCGNSTSAVVHDHIFLSTGHLIKGQWVYGKNSIVFGPEDDPSPKGFFAYHACEPEVIGGKFGFAGRSYRWAMFFTAESVANNATNQLGVAFANNLSGPWKPHLTPIVQTVDDFGHNQYPYDCPPNDYCLGQPAAISAGSSGHIYLTYMSNAGSPGTNAAPREGLVLRELNLSSVPAGLCTKCLVPLPNGKSVEAVTQSGLGRWPSDDATIALDSATDSIVMGYDSGPPNLTADEAPVTPWVTVATIPESGFVSGLGKWTINGAVGSCLSGHTLNHNGGIVRTSSGMMPNPQVLSMLFTVANHNLGGVWGVWGYRMWDLETKMGFGLTTQATATANCDGYNLLSTTGYVTSVGATHSYGSTALTSRAQNSTALTMTRDRQGYYLVNQKGVVTPFGDAIPQRPLRGLRTGTTNAVGIALDQGTGGYWVADASGAVYTSNAPNLGSLLTKSHTGSVVAIASIPTGVGYYLTTSTGQVYAFGNAESYGDFGTTPPSQPIAAMAVTPDGQGYYLLSNDGLVAAYGTAKLFGPGQLGTLTSPTVGIGVTPDGLGYWVVTGGGSVIGFGDATSGSEPGSTGGGTVAGIAVT